MSGYSEVFKFIVDKGDVVISGLFLNVLQGIGKGDVLKGVRCALATDTMAHSNSMNDSLFIMVSVLAILGWDSCGFYE